MSPVLASVPDDDDRYFSIATLARYADMAERTIRRHLKGANPIPHYRIGGNVRVRKSQFDAWVEAHSAGERQRDRSLDAKVAAAVRSIRGR